MPRIHPGAKNRESCNTSKSTRQESFPQSDSRVQSCVHGQLRSSEEWKAKRLAEEERLWKSAYHKLANRTNQVNPTQSQDSLTYLTENTEPEERKDSPCSFDSDEEILTPEFGLDEQDGVQDFNSEYNLALNSLRELSLAEPNDDYIIVRDESGQNLPEKVLLFVMENESRDISNRTPIEAALYQAAQEKLKDQEGRTPLHYVMALKGAKPNWINAWGQGGGPFETVTTKGETALSIAFNAGNFDCVRHLMNLTVCKDTDPGQIILSDQCNQENFAFSREVLMYLNPKPIPSEHF